MSQQSFLLRRNRTSQLPDAPAGAARVMVDAAGNLVTIDENRKKIVVSPADPLSTISANVTITSDNESLYWGRTLVFTGAFTVTLSAGLTAGFGFNVRPPASGNASIASANTGGLPTLNGATTTITRARAANALFAVQGVAADDFVVTGA